MTDGKPNAYLVGEKMFVQVTSQYHTPFELSIEGTMDLVNSLNEQLVRYAVKNGANPYCKCGSTKSYHNRGVGACGKGEVSETGFGAYHLDNNCKKFRLDTKLYKRDRAVKQLISEIKY